MTLTPSELERFRERGYVVRKGFLAPAEVGRIGAWLDGLGASDEARYYEQSPITGESLLVRVEHFLGPENPEVTAILLSGEVRTALAELLGEPAQLFKEKANLKLPGCRADKLHQDQSAGWNAYADYFVTMAVAIDANRRDNAALSFLDTGRYPKELIAPEWQPLRDDDPPYEPVADYALIEADPGDAIFFDSYVPHGSPANLSDRQRRNVYVTFNRRSAGDLRQRYYREKWASYPPNQRAAARPGGTYRV